MNRRWLAGLVVPLFLLGILGASAYAIIGAHVAEIIMSAALGRHLRAWLSSAPHRSPGAPTVVLPSQQDEPITKPGFTGPVNSAPRACQ